MIRFENVTKMYPRQEKAALDGVNLEIAKGEFVKVWKTRLRRFGPGFMFGYYKIYYQRTYNS